MIEEVATVLSIEDLDAVIQVEKTSSCHSCNANSACGTASISRYFNFQAPQLKVKNTINAKPGDQVLLGIPDSEMLMGSFILYMVPLITLFILSIFFSSLNTSFPDYSEEFLSIVGGGLGLMIGLFGVKKYSHLIMKNGGKPVMMKIMNKASSAVFIDQIKIKE